MNGPRIIRIYMILAGLYTLAASLIWSVNTLFLLDAGLSIGQVFIANALFSAGMVVFEIPTGVIADTLGRRVSYLLSVTILALTTLLYLIAAQAEAGVWVFGAASILMGLGFTFYSGALEAWLVDALGTVDSEQRLDHVFARGQQVSGSAMLVGTISGGLLGQIDLAVPFLVRSGLLVAVFGIAAILMHDIGFETRPLEARRIPRAMTDQARVGITFGWGQRGLRLLMLSAAARATFFGWAFYAAQPYFLELLERDAVWIVGLVTAGVSLATIVGNQIVDWLSRWCGRRSTILMWATGAGTAASVVIGLTSTFAVAVAGLLVVAGAMGVMMPVRQSYLHQVTASEHRATVVSFDAMVSSVGGVGGQLGLGALSDARGFSAGYITGGAFTVLALPLLWRLRLADEPADQLVQPGETDATCPTGLPRTTQVAAIPVSALVSDDETPDTVNP